MLFATADQEIMFQLLLSTALGIVIGIERQIHGKPAGMRTLALVALGSTLFTAIAGNFDGQVNLWLTASVVSGIGFLAAGTVFRAEKHVQGLTTAAELWIVAAIGIAVGVGFYLIAFFTTILVLAIIIGGRFFEHETEEEFERHRRLHGEKW